MEIKKVILVASEDGFEGIGLWVKTQTWLLVNSVKGIFLFYGGRELTPNLEAKCDSKITPNNPCLVTVPLHNPHPKGS